MMMVKPGDLIHKTWLLRLLTGIADNAVLSSALIFKGGTAASMLGFLDRFSVDLDFDIKPDMQSRQLLKELQPIFKTLDLAVHRQSSKTLSFVLKYPNPRGDRNNLKLSAVPNRLKANRYEPQYLPEIDRMFTCQTIETMFANKLVTPLDRFRKYRLVAGRDFYDLHHFFLAGYRYDPAILRERTSVNLADFLEKLLAFTQKRLTEKIITEDLNTLLPVSEFQKIRKTLKTEILMFLENDLKSAKQKN